MFLLVVTFGLLLCMDEKLNSRVFSAAMHISNASCLGGDDPYSLCVSVDTSLSEYRDFEEKGILKDARTSYVPPEPTFIPLQCGLDNIVFKGLDLTSAHYPRTGSDRQIRSFDPSEQFLQNDFLQSDDPNNNIPWETSGFHSFWKGEGTVENIRVIQAKAMKSYMDTTANPCVDFYQFACGNWVNLNPIPKDKAGYDTFEMLRESLDIVLRDLLEEGSGSRNMNGESATNILNDDPIQGVSYIQKLKSRLETIRFRKEIRKKRRILDAQNWHSSAGKTSHHRRRRRRFTVTRSQEQVVDAEQKAKDLYASCMDIEVLEKRGLQPLLDLLTNLGGWPVLEKDWDESKFSWLELAAQLRLYNNDVFIVEWVGPDIKNSEENIIQFDQTSLGLPTRDYFLQESNRPYLDAYRIFMETIMRIMGVADDLASQTAEEIVQFETELAKITSSSEDRANVSMLYKQMTLRELHHLVPEIDWNRYLAIVQDRPIQESETVVIYALEYMQHLVVLLSRTKPRLIANYLVWRFVRHRVNNLDDRFQDAKQKFFQVLFGRERCPPRWKNCVGQVNSNMGMALGAMFVRKYFDENSKKDTLKMTHELQEAFRAILNSTDWLDEQTKHLAELKVSSMSLKIGYPDFILAKGELNKKYEGLYIDAKTYFENTLNVLRHVSRTEQKKLEETVNKTAWQTAPAIVNAYYSRNKNQIMFPAGILQPPFYHRFFPRCLNYGGIGVVIGHELTHGFDDKGRLFDRNGNIHKWWSDFSINGFHERARCLVSQYGNYTVDEVGIPVDGESTQGENIADNGGIRQAFRAYENWLARNATPEMIENESLPGLNLTNKQLFFLNFAQVWCGVMRPEATRSKLKTAVHSPGKFRVIGTLSNSIDFAREFQCPRGSPMNPMHKCSVW